MQPKWGKLDSNARYSQLVEQRLNVVKNASATDNMSTEDYVNNMFNNICHILHDCTKEAGIIPKKCYTPKAFWCPELSLLRDKKRFWLGNMGQYGAS